MERSGGACEICAYGFTPVLHVHHIFPVAMGGTPLQWNLIALCPNCHALVHKYGALPEGDTDLKLEHLLEWTPLGEEQGRNLLLVASRNASVNTFGEIEENNYHYGRHIKGLEN